MGARREVVSAVTERYRTAKRAEEGRTLDALCATTGWHRKRAVRALRQHEPARPNGVEASRERGRKSTVATIKDALKALWGCGRPRIDCCTGAMVTFADAAIRLSILQAE